MDWLRSPPVMPSSRAFFLLLGALTACSPAAPPPSTPAPTASVATSDSPSGNGWSTMDPRAIRCGIDDRPRNVMGAALVQPAREEHASRLLAEAPAFPPNAGARAPRRIVPTDMMPEPVDPGPPPPQLIIERLPMGLTNGGPLPAELSTAFSSINPQYEVCNTLAGQDAQGGPVTFELELASSGAPLRVLPVGEHTISPHERCLMERACQYQTHASLSQLTRVRVPLRVNREQPPPPPTPPTPPAQPQVRVDASSEAPSQNLSELQLQLRTLVADAARSCGAVDGRAQVRFILETVTTDGFPRPRPRPMPRQRMVMPTPLTTIQQVKTQNLNGSVNNNQLACIVGILTGQSLRSFGAPKKHVERVMLTWNP